MVNEGFLHISSINSRLEKKVRVFQQSCRLSLTELFTVWLEDARFLQLLDQRVHLSSGKGTISWICCRTNRLIANPMWFSMILYVYNVRRTWISSHAVRKIKKSNMKHTFIMNTYAKSVPVPASCAWCHRHQAPAQRSTTPQLAAPQPPVMRGIPSHPDVYSRNPTGSCSSTWEMFFVCHQWSAQKKWTEWLDLCQPLDKIRCSPVCYLSCQPTTQGCRPALGFWYFDLKKDMVQAWLQQGSYRHHGPEKQENFLKLPLFNMFHWNFKLCIVII